jgi:hypothetical protein
MTTTITTTTTTNDITAATVSLSFRRLKCPPPRHEACWCGGKQCSLHHWLHCPPVAKATPPVLVRTEVAGGGTRRRATPAAKATPPSGLDRRCRQEHSSSGNNDLSACVARNKRKILTMTTTTQWQRRWKGKGQWWPWRS